MSVAKPEPPPGSNSLPRIPEKYLDVPSQRLYYLSLGLLCQAIKIFDFLQYCFSFTDSTAYYGRKWLLVDLTYCVVLSQLRIPRLNYSKAVILLQILSFWFFDGLLFGGIRLNVFGGSSEGTVSTSGFRNRLELPSTPEPFRLSSFLSSFTLIPSFSSSLDHSSDAHLLGQHTIRMSPISTAQLNPYAHTFCLSSQTGNNVLIPILLNNTDVANVRYTVTPLGYVEGESGTGKIEYVELNAKDLKAIEMARAEGLQVTRPTTNSSLDVDDYYDEYDDDDDDDEKDSSRASHSTLQKTQSLTHIRLKKPGTVRLERVLDTSNVAARLSHPLEVAVVPCPQARFATEQLESIRCAGQDPDLQLTIDIRGVPPLSLRWFKEVNGKKEHFLVEGIEGSHDHPHHEDPLSEFPLVHGRRKTRVSKDLKVPLSVSLDAIGMHMYVLEEIIDGVGNVVLVSYPHILANHLGHRHDTNPMDHNLHSPTIRYFSVLRRPNMFFKNCGPGNPTSLLVGSEAQLTIAAIDADALDAPWEVLVKYQPPTELEKSGGKRFKPWKKSLKTQQENKELNLRVSSPGEYTILGVKGKWCEGDVLAPETCKVVEMSRPSAEIEWKRIHECSGDTGVSASLVLHGTPPFQVYYRTQRDQEAPRDLVKTFPNSRGELTLQPERSGHYIYSFIQMSDANYKKIELNGPSIDQVVHPLAAAEFVGAGAGARSKRMINSCSGNVVDVEVDLRGTGPWNLEIQIVGPRSSETLQIPEIKPSRATLQVPIPDAIDKEGGSFDIELVSVEDSYGCMRSISVPGISVNVRRVQPTAKFYGKEGRHHVTVLEHERAQLPLRLTGDGPWRVKYRRAESPETVKTATLKTPNAELSVVEDGLYEIIEVMDSQCPGSVSVDESTYQVDWIPRPSAKLAPETEAIYTSHNRSHVLPPICEGLDDHIDLDLTGRAPFQILYNIAQDDRTGGTNILEQPTFSSIQHRTRFQLHTSLPGRKYYEVKQIGDASYPLAKHKNAFIPRSERLLFEQEVFTRPTARFRNNNRISYCLNDALVPRDGATTDGQIQLVGTPPFEIQLSIKNLATSTVDAETIRVTDKIWTVSLPSYTFESIGPHLITIESIQDASRCEQAALDPLFRSIWVDVAEIATIIPFNRREDFCVGEVSQFQLEGTPPWTIGYRINGKSYIQEAKVSPFSLLQQQPGEITITSVAHQQKMCKAAVIDLRFTVHPLPAARVGHGQRIYQDIHEGDQAEIVFTLIGEPPFTFTYQRAEPSPRKGGKPGKVLETHTVSGVSTQEYSIFSALEGTWTVTSISDRHCRYPPAQPDSTGGKSRRLTS